MTKLKGNISAKGKGFDNFPENINKNGRPMSVKKNLQALLNSNGKVEISKKDVIKINDNGSVIIRLPTAEQIAYKLSKIATTGKNMNTLKAIEIILKQTDQEIEKVDTFDNYDFDALTDNQNIMSSTLLAMMKTNRSVQDKKDIENYRHTLQNLIDEYDTIDL